MGREDIVGSNSAGFRLVRLAASAGMLLALSAELVAASPARVVSNTNLRLGPGTNFGVAATVPGGSVVDVTGCAAQWCTAHWRGRTGYMIATNLDLGGQGGPVGGPPVVIYDDPPPYFGPPYYYGPAIAISGRATAPGGAGETGGNRPGEKGSLPTLGNQRVAVAHHPGRHGAAGRRAEGGPRARCRHRSDRSSNPNLLPDVAGAAPPCCGRSGIVM